MKVKTYNSRTLEITIEPLRFEMKFQETNEAEHDFVEGAEKEKKYPLATIKLKKKWLKKPSLTDALLGGVISTVMAVVVQYYFY